MTLRQISMAALAAAAVCLPVATNAKTPAPVSEAVAAPSTEADNKAIVEGLYRAFAAGDGAAIGAVFSPDIVWNEAEGGPYADHNPYTGPAAVFEGVFGRIGQQWQGFAATPVTVLPSGDKVVVLGRYTGVNKATGRTLNAQFAHVYTLVDGKIVGFQQYTDTAQWVATSTAD